jgi:hypothetical protein
MAVGRSGKGTAFAFAALALAFVARCSGESFSSGDGASGGTTGGGTTGGGAAGSGGSGKGGEAGSGGSAGGSSGSTASGGGTGAAGGADAGGSGSGGQADGGAGGDAPCDETTPCPAGRYCGSDGACTPCSDLVLLDDPGAARFGAAEPLSVINDSAGDWFLRAPRAFGSGNGLVYVRDFLGGEIWLTGDADGDIGAPLPSPINEPDFLEGSPLWFDLDQFEGLNFVFNRAADRSSPTELFAARVAANGTALDLAPLPSPFNPTPRFSEGVYAMALSGARAWWTVNRDLMFHVQLLTAPLEQEGPPSIVSLRLTDDCPLTEVDFSPWATPDGRLLFVNGTERGPACELSTGQPQDIVVFRMNEAGQPLGPGYPLASVNHPGVSEIDASLSPDMCTLYFVTLVSDKLRIMKAKRSG